MNSAAVHALQNLGRDYPEWRPWLAVVYEVVQEAADRKWESCVPERARSQESGVPLLAGARIALDPHLLRKWTQSLFRAASLSGAPKLRGLKPSRLNHTRLFEASLRQDHAALETIASEWDVETSAFQSVAALLAVPFLQACHRVWHESPVAWTEGYCYLCGAWPVLAEVRGIERSRYFRCGRCGGEWQAHCLFCPFCGMTNHEQLISLLPENGGPSSLDACKRCLGYVKSFTTLEGSPPGKIMLDDLASVTLDLAALEKGYRRPQGPGQQLRVSVSEKPGLGDRIFGWRK